MHGPVYLACLLIVAALPNAVAVEPPDTPTANQIAQLLYPNEGPSARGGKHFVYKAWKKFPGRYIVASYGEPEGARDELLRVDIALVQYDRSVPEVISRRTFRYAHGVGAVDRLEIDTANYQIADNVTAFGLRSFSLDAGSGYEHHYESLDLYVLGTNGINHVAGNLAFGDGGLIESHNEYNYCNNPNFCELVWSREVTKTIVIVTPNRTNGYFDLIAKTVETEESGSLDSSDISRAPEKPRAETTTRVFRWDGESYGAD